MTRTKSPAVAPLFVVALVLAFILVPQLASFYVDWLWFESVELPQVFVTSFKAQAFWSLAGGLLGFLVAFVSHLAMVRATRGRVVTVSFQNQAALQLDVPKHLDRLALAAPALAAFVVGSLFAANWLKFLLQAGAAPFGSVDPVFGRDISFYVFSLPVLEIVGSGLLLALGIALLAAAAMYFLKGALLLTNRGVSRRAAGLGAPGRPRQPALSRAGVQHLRRDARRPHLDAGARRRRDLHRHPRAPAGDEAADRARRGRGGPDPGEHLRAARRARGLGHRRLPRRRRRRGRRLPGAAAQVRGGAERTGQGDALHQAEHRRDAPGLRPRRGRGAQHLGADRSRPRGRREERRDHQEHPPLGPPAAARHVQPGAGDPHLLRLHHGEQRPLPDQRRVPADHALAARALQRQHPDEELDQRDADLHPRLRADARAGHAGDARGAAGAAREGHPAGLHRRRDQDHPARDLLREALEQPRHRQHEVEGVRLPGGRGQRLHRVRRRRRGEDRLAAQEAGVRGALRLDEAAALERHHRAPAGSSITGTSPSGSAGSCPSCGSTATRTWWSRTPGAWSGCTTPTR